MSEMPTVSVTELVQALKEVVEGTLPPICVQGEISNYRPSASGHVYFTLKDERSEIRTVMWRGVAERLRFQPKDGLKVLATGSLEVYVPRGSCQFIVQRLLPDGIGELELAFRELKDKLQSEGLFDQSRKQSLPLFPRRIGLVTSPTSAAVRDMIHVMTRRWPGVDIVILPVPVQGTGAAPRIAKAIQSAPDIEGIDVLIVGRGGGSLEDLWAFNEEVLARAIADCPLPIVSAVGHETDLSIADFVSDQRALTPSEAAELVVPSASEIRSSLNDLALRMHRTTAARLNLLRERLVMLENRRILKSPGSLVDDRRQTTDEYAQRAERAIRQQLERTQQRLAAKVMQLDALSPLKVLARGYSLAYDSNHQIVKSLAQVVNETELRTQLTDGTVYSKVLRTEPGRPFESP